SQLVQFEQQLASGAETFVDLKTSIEAWVIDQPLPSHGCPRLLEVDAHDDYQVRFESILFHFQFSCVLERGVRIVNRARPDYHEQAVVGSVEDPMELVPGVVCDFGSTPRQLKF